MVNNLRKVQFEYLEFLFKGMFSVKSKYYPDSTFFKRDDKVILELEKSGTLWVLYSVWTNISDMFSYGYEETQQLIKEWVESQLKKGEVAPKKLTLYAAQYMGIKIKSEEVTPLDAGSNYLPFMEKQLKSAEITPLQGCVSPFSMDGEELTPQQMNYVIIGEIEEESKSAEVTPKNAIAPPYSWRNLKTEEITPFMEEELAWVKVEEKLKTEEVTPHTSITNQLMRVQEELKSEEITPRQVVSGSFDWVQEQINLGEVTPRNSLPPLRWTNLKSEELTQQI